MTDKLIVYLQQSAATREARIFGTVTVPLYFLANRLDRNHDALVFAAAGFAATLLVSYVLTLFSRLKLERSKASSSSCGVLPKRGAKPNLNLLGIASRETNHYGRSTGLGLELLTTCFFCSSERIVRLGHGQTMTEYTLVLSAVAVYGIYKVLGNKIDKLASGVDSELTNA
jgi:Flp pilus assembly pilin Flp